jgi:hypothetical protein
MHGQSGLAASAAWAIDAPHAIMLAAKRPTAAFE